MIPSGPPRPASSCPSRVEASFVGRSQKGIELFRLECTRQGCASVSFCCSRCAFSAHIAAEAGMPRACKSALCLATGRHCAAIPGGAPHAIIRDIRNGGSSII